MAQDTAVLVEDEIERHMHIRDSLVRGGREYTSTFFSELPVKLQLPGPGLLGPFKVTLGNLWPSFGLVW